MPTYPIQLKRSGTASATPSSLVHGELAINYNVADGKLFWKDSSNVIQSFTFQAYALSSHSHGNITNAGAIGSTANLPIITTTSGVLTTGSFGTSAATFCEGNDSRLSDTRTPTDGSVTTAKIANDAVTYAKLQNVSATDRLLGRSSAGAGDVEEITCTAFGRSLIDDADAAAARSTLSVQPTASPAFTGTVSAAAVTLSGQLLVTAGSASACGVAFSGDTNTGLAQIGGADTASLVTAGVERVRVDATGNVGIGSTTNLTAVLNFPAADSGEVINYYPSATESVRSGVGKYSAEVRHYVPAGDVFTWRTGGPSGTERLKLSASLLTVGTGVSVTASQVYSDTVGATNRDLFIDNTGKLGYVSSIRASKTGITAIDDVSWLRELTPVSFRYRKRNEDGTFSDEPDGTLDYGLIAEDVEPVAPELCFYDVVDGKPHLRGVHYSKLVTPMLRYIQQLEQRIAALEEKLSHG